MNMYIFTPTHTHAHAIQKSDIRSTKTEHTPNVNLPYTLNPKP